MADILGIGVDIVDIHRIATMRERQGDRFGSIIFLPDEIAYCMARAKPDECFAARFAAKEAVMKALGTGWAHGVAFTGIEVIMEESGKPGIALHGSTRDKAKDLGAGHIHLSLSHGESSAIAQVVIEKN